MEFLGYERPDGSAGVRNHVAVLSSGRCANGIAAQIADAVTGATAILHTYPCPRLKEDNDRALMTLSGIGSNPNVASVVLVGIGCENPPPDQIAEEIAKAKKPIEILTIQKSKGYSDLLDRGLAVKTVPAELPDARGKMWWLRGYLRHRWQSCHRAGL